MNAEQISAKLQMLIDSFVAKGKMVHHAVLGVASDREGFQWAGAAGVANPATGQPMTPDTPLLIASISKMYTAAAIMLLHEQSASRSTTGSPSIYRARWSRGSTGSRGRTTPAPLRSGI